MFGVGLPELLVIFVVALIVLGPKRLPEVARALGKGLAEFRRATAGLTEELNNAQTLIEREARETERAARTQAAAKAAPPGSQAKPPEAKPAAAPPAEAQPSEATASEPPPPGTAVPPRA